MKTNRFLVLAVVFLVALFFAAACSPIEYERQQTMGSEVYSRGHLASVIKRPLAAVQDAVVAAYRGFGIKITKAASDRLSGVVQGTLASGDAADTRLSSITGEKTEVSIKVGEGGNQYISHRLLEAIKHALKLTD